MEKVHCKNRCGFEDEFELDELGINFYQSIGECPNCGANTVYEDGEPTKVEVRFIVNETVSEEEPDFDSVYEKIVEPESTPVIEQKEDKLLPILEHLLCYGRVHTVRSVVYTETHEEVLNRLESYLNTEYKMNYSENGNFRTKNPKSKQLTPKDETVSLDFVRWYSGMSKSQILKAYERFLNEVLPQNQTKP